MAKREKIGKGVVKNTGKESTALIDTSSKEEMEEVEGNEKDSSIGQEFFITFDDEGGNLPFDSYEYMEEEDNNLFDGVMKKMMMKFVDEGVDELLMKLLIKQTMKVVAMMVKWLKVEKLQINQTMKVMAQSREAAYQTDKESNGISSHSGLFIQGGNARGENCDDTFGDTFILHTYPSSPKV
ncbi:hypothetical protein Scep_026488 [Stephania cephalantha]|uniref:Uncharacterized protein n=1 Tax=Stephania cephalantha TaxID=152367 RepID=A0AAP0EU45_9MAGN